MRVKIIATGEGLLLAGKSGEDYGDPLTKGWVLNLEKQTQLYTKIQSSFNFVNWQEATTNIELPEWFNKDAE